MLATMLGWEYSDEMLYDPRRNTELAALYLDVLLTTNGGPVKLFRNDLDHADRRWLRVRVVGRHPNPGAVGASVTLHAGDGSQHRTVRADGSYLTQSETNPMLFGLATTPDSLSLLWPDGTVETFRDVPAGHLARVVRGAQGSELQLEPY